MEAKAQIPAIEESTIIERVARIVSGGHEWRGTKPDYAHLAGELEPAIPFDVFGIVLLRHDRQAVRVTVCTREVNIWVEQHHQLPLADSMTERMLAHPAMLVQNYPQELDGPPALSGDALSRYPQLRSTLIAPLAVGERVLGILELGSTIPNTYSDEALQRLIRAVVHVLAAAIESAQTGGSVEIQDRQRQALKQVSSALTSTMDLPTILQRIVVGVTEALNVASAIVMLDRQQPALRLEAQSGLDLAVLRRVIEARETYSERSIIGYTLQRRQPIFSNDISTDERFPASRVFASRLAVHSIFSYPLVTGTTVYGALLLCSSEPGGFTPLKADILSLFAGQATIAIHTGVLLEAAQERSRFQEAIEQLEQAHQQKIDESVLLERVREESERTFGVSFANILRFISDHLLTRNERDLQSLLHGVRQGDTSVVASQSDDPQPVNLPALESLITSWPSFTKQETSVTRLTQTAEVALARADILRDIGAALAIAQAQGRLSTSGKEIRSISGEGNNEALYEQSAGDTTDAWFVADLDGRCIYMNPAAEVFCGMRLMEPWEDFSAGNTLADVFAPVLPRMRDAAEIAAYLRDFAMRAPAEDYDESSLRVRRSFTGNSIRCVLSAGPVVRSVPGGDSYLSSRQATLSGGQVASFIEEPARSHASGSTSLRQPESEALQKSWHTLGSSRGKSHSKDPNRSLADRFYRLMRYPLHDRSGQLLANALQICDITDQVRDEENKSALLSSVSHELRTPLTTIKAGLSGLLQPGVDWDDSIRDEILKDIEAEADHLDVLVNALVDMSRIEMGALVLEKEWCDCVEIVNTAITRAGRILAGRPVRLVTLSHLPLIQADYAQLERVFRNLLENAAYRSSLIEDANVTKKLEILVNLQVVNAEAGQVLPLLGPSRDDALRGPSWRTGMPGLRTSASLSLSEEQPGNHVLLAQVIDRGPCIPEAEREHIFKTFYSQSGVPGSGLGLAICRGIIEAHQGSIWVELTPDKASCFSFTLPAHLLASSRATSEVSP